MGGVEIGLLALGLGATIEKERAAPRGGRALGPTDGRRPCARVAREGELSLVRALPLFPSYTLKIENKPKKFFIRFPKIGYLTS